MRGLVVDSQDSRGFRFFLLLVPDFTNLRRRPNMTVGINARMVTFVAHALAVVVLVMVLYWSIRYMGVYEQRASSLMYSFSLDLSV